MVKRNLKMITKSIDGVGTFGTVYDGEAIVCRTVEQPWNNNKPFDSCIPAGIYDVSPHDSPSKGKCFILTNIYLGVTKSESEDSSLRDNCLFHVANYPEDVEGCVGPGLSFMPDTGRWGVANSKKALDKLMNNYPDGFKLEIIRL